MSFRLLPVACSLAVCVPVYDAPGDEWKDLLDPGLTQWEMYLGIPHKSVGIEWQRRDEHGRARPLGVGNDPLGVFTTREADGQTELVVSGQVFGVLATLESFANYHFSLQVCWGHQKWPPRLNKPRDTGILYHSTGEHGAHNNNWMQSVECQIEEGGLGDFWSVHHAAADIRVRHQRPDTHIDPRGRPFFDPLGSRLPFGRRDGFEGVSVKHSQNLEQPRGDWNTVEIYALEDESIHVVNGEPVMLLENIRQLSGDGFSPLTRGRIQIQSEGARVFCRRVRIRPITEFPRDIAVDVGVVKP